MVNATSHDLREGEGPHQALLPELSAHTVLTNTSTLDKLVDTIPAKPYALCKFAGGTLPAPMHAAAPKGLPPSL